MNAERTLPAGIDSEKQVLGSILLDASGFAYHQAVSAIKPGDLSLDSHRRIFGRMIELMESGKPIDFNTLTEQLGQNKEIELVGGIDYITSLTDGMPRIKNIGAYTDTVLEKSQLRSIIHIANSAAEAAYGQERPAKQIVAQLDEALLQIQANSHKTDALRVCQFSDATFIELEELRKSSNRTVGFSTGLDGLDFRTTGIRRKDFWIIGGRPGNGKTALALEMIQANASQDIPVGFFSLEMPKERILHRLWSSFGRVDFNRIRVPSSSNDEDWSRIRRAMAEVGTWPLFIDDSADLSISEINARARLMIKRHEVGLILVDYLQIVDAGGRDERARLTKISKTLRMLAKKENVAVVGLSQLARPNVKDLNKRPQLWDLKESGTLEADADTVLLLYRPVDEYDQFLGKDEIIIGKQRSGETSIEQVVYLGRHMRFEEREPDSR